MTALGEGRAQQTLELTGTAEDVETAVIRFHQLGVAVPQPPDGIEYRRTIAVSVRRIS